MTDGALEIRRLSAGYRRRTIVHDLTLAPLPVGHVTALVGPNGAGKSTLMRAIAGLLPASGEVFWKGRSLLALSRQDRAAITAFMPQALPSGVGLSVLETVMTAIKVSRQGIDGKSLRRKALHVLEQLEVAHLALTPLDRLSGGQRQMAALAQALAPDPELLLLDEPTSALDLRHQFHIMRTIRSIAASGCSVVMVLHDLGQASDWADTIVVLDGGTLHVQGAPVEAITPEMLRSVYRIEAGVHALPGGKLRLDIADMTPAPSAQGWNNTE